jgi:hypothetical protein
MTLRVFGPGVLVNIENVTNGKDKANASEFVWGGFASGVDWWG